MEDTANKEIDRQDFSRLYGLEFEQMGICRTRVEENEICLFKLKRSLVQEQTEERRQRWDEQKHRVDLAEALAQ
eukprot:7305166-Heterocapsa_arctica.AAC.1